MSVVVKKRPVEISWSSRSGLYLHSPFVHSRVCISIERFPFFYFATGIGLCEEPIRRIKYFRSGEQIQKGWPDLERLKIGLDQVFWKYLFRSQWFLKEHSWGTVGTGVLTPLAQLTLRLVESQRGESNPKQIKSLRQEGAAGHPIVAPTWGAKSVHINQIYLTNAPVRLPNCIAKQCFLCESWEK